jgi:hypothetical protein
MNREDAKRRRSLQREMRVSELNTKAAKEAKDMGLARIFAAFV